MLTHDLERFGAGHAGETAGEGDGRLQRRAIEFRRRHDDESLLAVFFLAGRRPWTLGAGAFFFSVSRLARSASIKLTTRGAGPALAGSIFSPASFFLSRSTRAFSYRS